MHLEMVHIYNVVIRRGPKLGGQKVASLKATIVTFESYLAVQTVKVVRHMIRFVQKNK